MLNQDISNYELDLTSNTTPYQIEHSEWTFKTLSRSKIQGGYDTFAIHCKNGVWYIPRLDIGVRAETNSEIQDMAYQRDGDMLFVLFKDSNDIYEYANISEKQNSANIVVVLSKDLCDKRYKTFNSICLVDEEGGQR